ncbi:hypothetical protein GCM10025868_33000 [Angustibacter aerolatus]|uniref:Uncharacterized protein n=1 Tax=Angustibacter aerolatus TaxID=1162965 RepID=A0ABQ6JIK2_9ACTN|nr:hypothetical protein GCM10025868_33000 [Angustibacter aerolatus]
MIGRVTGRGGERHAELGEPGGTAVERRQHPQARLADGHGVLEVRRAGAVDRDDGPPVVQHAGVGVAPGEHGLDGDGEARLHPHALVAHAVVRHLRVLVHLGADAVTDVVLDDAVRRAVGGGDAVLDRGPDVEQPTADAERGDALPHGVLGDPQQRGVGRVGRVEGDRDRGVPMPAVQHGAAVDAHDVAGLEHPLPGMPCTTSSFTDTHSDAGKSG